jgi:hypothetical protein
VLGVLLSTVSAVFLTNEYAGLPDMTSVICRGNAKESIPVLGTDRIDCLANWLAYRMAQVSIPAKLVFLVPRPEYKQAGKIAHK